MKYHKNSNGTVFNKKTCGDLKVAAELVHLFQKQSHCVTRNLPQIKMGRGLILD